MAYLKYRKQIMQQHLECSFDDNNVCNCFFIHRLKVNSSAQNVHLYHKNIVADVSLIASWMIVWCSPSNKSISNYSSSLTSSSSGHMCIVLGVALTGRSTTGPPCSVTDDDRRQTTRGAREQSNTAPYTMCRQASNTTVEFWWVKIKSNDQ